MSIHPANMFAWPHAETGYLKTGVRSDAILTMQVATSEKITLPEWLAYCCVESRPWTKHCLCQPTIWSPFIVKSCLQESNRCHWFAVIVCVLCTVYSLFRPRSFLWLYMKGGNGRRSKYVHALVRLGWAERSTKFCFLTPLFVWLSPLSFPFGCWFIMLRKKNGHRSGNNIVWWWRG